MVNKSPNNPKEFAFLDGDAPSSTTTIVSFSLIGRYGITIFFHESNQQLITLQHQAKFWAPWDQKSIP
jgi:hypothetical protein